MTKQRPRPWVDPTPLVGFVPEWGGQFDTFEDWVNFAPKALSFEGSVGEQLPAVCFDAIGRRCNVGKDFMRARDENTFPVRYFVTGKLLPGVASVGNDEESVKSDEEGFDRWCYTAKEADGFPLLTHLLHRVCEGSETRFETAVDLLRKAFEAGRYSMRSADEERGEEAENGYE